MEDATSFNETNSVTIHLIDVNETSPVFVTTLTCSGSPRGLPDFSASVSVEADVQAKLDAEFGFIFSGSIIPPHIDDLAFTSSTFTLATMSPLLNSPKCYKEGLERHFISTPRLKVHSTRAKSHFTRVSDPALPFSTYIATSWST